MTREAPSRRGRTVPGRLSGAVQRRAVGLLQDVRRGLLSLALAADRKRALRRASGSGVTVIVATWNTWEYLAVLLEAVRRFSPPDVRLLVVDNASTDGTASTLRAHHPDVRLLRLPFNVGHGLALDAGIHAADTSRVVILDVDAFPVSSEWLPTVLGPLDEGAAFSGADFGGYVHPCFCAIDRRRFLERGHTFDASYTRRLRIRRRSWPQHWDAGRLISIVEEGPLHRIPVTSVRGPHVLGTVFGGVVYHHFYATRHKSTRVSAEESQSAWQEAIEQYLGIYPGRSHG